MSAAWRNGRPVCFSELLRLEGAVAQDPRKAGAAVERVLGCRNRAYCGDRLACSWMASELAQRAMRGFR